MQQLSIGGGSGFGCGGKCGVFRVGREQGVLAKAAMVGAARPRVSDRIIRHAGANGVKFDIAVAVQYIGFAVDQTGLVTTLP